MATTAWLVGCSSDTDAASANTGGTAAGGNSTAQTTEARNAIAFHLVDFVGWNNRDWAVMRHYHAADVKVLWVGAMREGIDNHIQDMEGFVTAFPDTRVLLHTPAVAQGDWTCVVGVAQDGASRMLTVARWRDAAIAEEYIFLAELAAGAATPAVTGPRLVSIENHDDTLATVAGAQPGWSCTLDGEAGPNMLAQLTHHTNGAVDQELTFVPLPSGN